MGIPVVGIPSGERTPAPAARGRSAYGATRPFALKAA